jgi:hypothetical protein
MLAPQARAVRPAAPEAPVRRVASARDLGVELVSRESLAARGDALRAAQPMTHYSVARARIAASMSKTRPGCQRSTNWVAYSQMIGT